MADLLSATSIESVDCQAYLAASDTDKFRLGAQILGLDPTARNKDSIYAVLAQIDRKCAVLKLVRNTRLPNVPLRPPQVSFPTSGSSNGGSSASSDSTDTSGDSSAAPSLNTTLARPIWDQIPMPVKVVGGAVIVAGIGYGLYSLANRR